MQLVPSTDAARSLIGAFVGNVDSTTMDALLQGTWDVYIDSATRYPVALIITPSSTTASTLAHGKISFSFGMYNTITAPPLDASSVAIGTVLGWMQDVTSSTTLETASSTFLH